ncbi:MULTISPECIES: formate dehydrogenase accessory sulfurtransferase FdhD [Aliiglaciecola]|uniref:formate dehydrogenase accessory sulfurtransferase FdhD n=1 Tax=Aliiglaciecola TaxID=1406885 RepID=UPI001C088BA6|nr:MULTISPECIES: formate dehydrogenase accessory sulfurtransferase FdhD [unclassified Aliiglaciecola]MBU2876671.1 formate dehydrogenase accessory sulfurtransferase FdhD [Aliiglaciecola lipolytica]MDO6710260.1 formate dehydrogenase accessory sulfurtransferase FdhD [Aliiglaciecola sp. 2_MG-2023]MDO6751408.1 formate dehydrogenase accessory sulfurtransferase FdhD [Aliiglaciecola sp. 1_MG-2023]
MCRRTSRCSAELVQKTRALGISILASFASPSTLALKLAQSYKMTLVHIPKQDLPNVYFPRPQNAQQQLANEPIND